MHWDGSLLERSDRRRGIGVALALLICAALAACQPSVNVSVTANVPAQYSHVWVTLDQVAFNTSATAAPTDSGWKQFTLSAPQTVDLTAVTNGTLSQIASNLSLPTGTYNQMRLVLVDSSAPLTSSAQGAGALYNDEVDTTSASGALERLPLEVPNAAQGVTLAVTLTVQSDEQAALAAFACGQSSSSGELGGESGATSSSTCDYGTQTASDCTAGSLYDSLIGSCIAIGSTAGLTGLTTGSTTSSCAYGTTYDSSTGACISTGTSVAANCSYNEVYDPTSGACTSSLGSAAATYEAVDFDAARDLVPYSLNGEPGFLLIPHLAGYDLAQTGTIEGQVDVSGLPAGVGGIEVTAETSNGTQNLIVESAPLESDGSFVLYPLPCSSTSTDTTGSGSSSSSTAGSCSSSTQNYDLVIHGPGIATVIIQQVPVSAGPPTAATAVSLGNVTLTAATSYTVNLSSAVSPPGAWVGFYQTLPSSSTVTVPYVIEARPVDPFTGTFDTAQSLSEGTPEYGVYSSGGTTLTSFVPTEGTSSTYSVGASAPLYGNGPLSTTVAPASSGTALFTATAIALPSGTTAESISGTVSVSSPGKYNEGELLLTADGALVAVAPLDAFLDASQSSATLFESVPGGTATSVYYAEAWVWNSSDPAGSLSRQPQSAPIDLTAGSASGVAITIN